MSTKREIVDSSGFKKPYILLGHFHIEYIAPDLSIAEHSSSCLQPLSDANAVCGMAAAWHACSVQRAVQLCSANKGSCLCS